MKWFHIVPVLLFLFYIQGILMLGSKVTQGKSEISWYNNNYYENPVMTLFDYDAATETKAINISYTLKKDLPDSVMMHMQLHKQGSNNEYRVFPLNFTGDMCPFLEKDTPELRKVKEHSNITACPMKKGFYYVSNLVMEKRKPPPYIPIGTYMAEATTSINNHINLLTTRSYFKVQ